MNIKLNKKLGSQTLPFWHINKLVYNSVVFIDENI